jgi:glycosyltransferase involved in cell wall biosynthesis
VEIHAAADRRVSAVVCVRNGERQIGPCLAAILANEPAEVIVVDGCSTDGTLAEVRKFPQVRAISDGGKGLSHARRIAVEAATGTHVLFVGPDNLLTRDFIARFCDLLDEWKFDAASVQTRVADPQTYWDRTVDFRWRCLMGQPGPISVVGTPSLYRREVFEAASFDDKLHSADDTDVSEQLLRAGYRLGLVPLLVQEFGGANLGECWGRFRFYGLGDHRFYGKYAPTWTRRRKLLSVSHPLRQTIRYSRAALAQSEAAVIPGLFVLMAARYWGWLKTWLQARSAARASSP